MYACYDCRHQPDTCLLKWRKKKSNSNIVETEARLYERWKSEEEQHTEDLWFILIKLKI